MIQRSEPCINCGRTNVHCPSCGFGGLYPIQELTLSLGLGKFDRGFRCKQCGAKFRESTMCTAELPKGLAKAKAAREEMVQDNSLTTREFSLRQIKGFRSIGKHEEANRLEKRFFPDGLPKEEDPRSSNIREMIKNARSEGREDLAVLFEENAKKLGIPLEGD